MSESIEEYDEQRGASEKKYFLKVLDDVVSLNSLFTVAVFIGLSFALPGPVQSLDENSLCHPNMGIRKRLVSFEIASFSCFVSSGIMAKTVKLFIYVYHDEVNPQRKRFILIPFYFSIYGTMCGCFFLILAMVDVIEVKLGRLSCGSKYSLNTVLVLVLTIGPALMTYFVSVTYGLFFAKGKKDVTATTGREIEKV